MELYKGGELHDGKVQNDNPLCSTRFNAAFREAQKGLNLEGNIVISVGFFGHSDGEVWPGGTKEVLY